MIDILYIYKHSTNDDQELKYSLRSLEKYVNDYKRIFITGDIPDFIDEKKVIYTPEKDIGAPMTNHWWKVIQTIRNTHDKNTYEFALMYDDIFFVKPTNLSNYPYYQRGDLGEDKNGGEHYQQTLLNAKQFLEEHGQTTYDFELHTPFVYDSYSFAKINHLFESRKDDCQSMAVRSVYGNTFHSDAPYRGDIKIRGLEKVEDVIGVADCFSVSESAFQYDTKRFLEKEFPNKSRWEK